MAARFAILSKASEESVGERGTARILEWERVCKSRTELSLKLLTH
jgi:hypothetical protein